MMPSAMNLSQLGVLVDQVLVKLELAFKQADLLTDSVSQLINDILDMQRELVLAKQEPVAVQESELEQV